MLPAGEICSSLKADKNYQGAFMDFTLYFSEVDLMATEIAYLNFKFYLK